MTSLLILKIKTMYKNTVLSKLIKRDFYLSYVIFSIVVKNRIKLFKLGNFVEISEVNKSDDMYGVWKNVNKLNKFLGFRLTNIDLIQFLSTLLSKKIVYTEIGVSVLKNFYLMANFLNNSKLYAFDINDIYKPMEKKFKIANKSEVKTNYLFDSNEIIYFKGNVFSSDDLIAFSDEFEKKTNLVYSDADHTEKGLMFEYEYFYNLVLDKEFILYFDDINSKTIPGFIKILEKIRTERPSSSINGYTFWINGWMGKNENQHRNGIISTLNIPRELKKNKIKLKNFKVI